MTKRCLLKFFVAGALLESSIATFSEAVAASPTNAPICTISTSRQFAVYADDRLLSSALCVYAERVKKEWLRRMDLPDEWRDPIVLIVRSCEPSQVNTIPISWLTFKTEKHLKYQIYCCASRTLNESELLAAIVDRLCAEWANRAQPTVRGQAYSVPLMPLWLVQGLAASINGRTDELRTAARRSVAAGHPQRASGLLNAKLLPEDAAERTLFQANAWMFTEGVLTLTNGAPRLGRFLTELGAQRSASNAFWSVYRRDFPKELALEKWWSLQQAGRVSVVVAQNLTPQETARQLDGILLTKFGTVSGRHGTPEETVIVLDEIWRYSNAAWLPEVLKAKSDRLGTLRGQAHPFYQPVIDQYLEALNWLLQRNTVRFRRVVEKAAAARIAAQQQSLGTLAYLDEAERIYAPEELSKPLTGYLTTLDKFQDLNQQRRNPISDYLDKFDR